jgi:hypothetical protein
MLSELNKNLRSEGIRRFKILQKRAEDVSFSKNTLDALFSFNAIHHFDLEQILPLLEESVHMGEVFPEFCPEGKSALHRRPTSRLFRSESPTSNI